MQNNLSKREIIDELWARGNLSYKLDIGQKQMYDLFYNSKHKMMTWLLARRSGKSFMLCVLAIEQCLRQPNSIVKMVSPTKTQLNTNMRPIFKKILDDCPDSLKPEFKTKDQMYFFTNGSEIQLAGSDGNHCEKLRGGDSHIWFIDEAGSCDGLDNLVKSILIPTTLITKGKGVLASTPPKEADHEFIRYIEEAELKGSLIKKTIHDNPRITKQDIEEMTVDLGGEHTDEFRREMLCVDEKTLVKTISGYKYIKDIEKNELVYTHLGRYKPVLNKFLNPLNNRNVYKVKHSNNLGLICTEGHQLYISKSNGSLHNGYSTEWIKVEDIKLKKSFKERTYFKVPIDKTLNINDYTKELVYLIGWHIAEGNLGKNQAVISLNYKDSFEKINDCCQKVWGKKYIVRRTQQGCFQAVLSSKKAKEFYEQFGNGAKNKFIPYELKTASVELKIELLKALFSGDGYYNLEARRAGYSSISIKLIGDISDILHSLDIPHQIAQVHKEGESEILGRKVYIQDSFGINIFGPNFDKFIGTIYNIKSSSKYIRSRNIIKDGFLFSRINKIEKINYKKDIVYDIEVQDDHSYVGLHSTIHNCELIKSATTSVLPEFTKELEKEVIKEWPKPPFYDAYVSMDLGGIDLTALLFGYYDFRNDKIIIEDEIEFDFSKQDKHLKLLVEEIKKKEADLWTNILTNEVRKPYLRVSDINIIATNEISKISHNQIYFKNTAKDDKESAINNVRILLSHKKIIINPRCVNLIRHLRNVRWASEKNKSTFGRSPDNGHYDFVDALIYFVRNVEFRKNPFPKNYDLNLRRDDAHFDAKFDQSKSENKTHDVLRSIFKVGGSNNTPANPDIIIKNKNKRYW